MRVWTIYFQSDFFAMYPSDLIVFNCIHVTPNNDFAGPSFARLL